MSAPAEQLDVAPELPLRVPPTLERIGDEWVVSTSCPRCHQPTEHRVSIEECPDEPSEKGVKLAGIILCSGCTAEEDAAKLQRQTKEAISARVKSADMPPSLIGLKFEDMLDGSSSSRRRAIEIVKEWSEHKQPIARPGLYLFGPVGVGKTRLAATAAWHRLEHSPIRWVSVAVLIAKLSAAWGDADRRDALKVLTGNGAIVLDDIDKSNPTEHVRNQLFPAIDQRVEAGAPMIVTANSSIGQLGDRLGEPIMSRLAGHCAQLELDGPDRRLELPGLH